MFAVVVEKEGRNMVLLPKNVVHMDVVNFIKRELGVVFMLLIIQGLYFSKMQDRALTRAAY